MGAPWPTAQTAQSTTTTGALEYVHRNRLGIGALKIGKATYQWFCAKKRPI
jgi:hypothetical protein